MNSKNSAASVALFLSFNLLFFSMVTANCNCNNPSNPKPTPTPTPSTPSTPTTPTTPAPSSGGKCPRDALKLGVCANLLQLVNVVVGSPSTLPCCTLIQGITGLEAAICLCTAIKANVLGVNLNVPVSLTLILNTCGKKLPSGFQCA